MSYEWKPGDRALCIDKHANRPAAGCVCDRWPAGSGPQYGVIYLVEDVPRAGWLVLAGEDPDFVWEARSFRKVVPACDVAHDTLRAVQ